LADGDQIAAEHGEDSDIKEEGDPAAVHAAVNREKVGKDGKNGSLERRSHKAGDRGRCPVIDIDYPGMEGEGGNLEKESDQDEKGSADKQRRPRRLSGIIGADHCKFGTADAAVDKGCAHGEKSSGKSAEHQVFQDGLGPGNAGPVIADENIDGKRHYFDRYEGGDQFLGHGQEQHPADPKHHDGVEFEGAENIHLEVGVGIHGGKKTAGEDNQSGCGGKAARDQHPVECRVEKNSLRAAGD